MPLIDSHAHLDFYTETPDALPSVLTRARAAGVETILAIGIGEGPETMHQALEIARQNEGVYASAGIHPQEAAHATPEALAKLAALAADPKCIAVGEIGLDYYHVGNPLPPVQHEAFVAQDEDRRSCPQADPDPLPYQRACDDSGKGAVRAAWQSRRRLGRPACAYSRALDAAWDWRHYALLFGFAGSRRASRSRLASICRSPAT